MVRKGQGGCPGKLQQRSFRKVNYFTARICGPGPGPLSRARTWRAQDTPRPWSGGFPKSNYIVPQSPEKVKNFFRKKRRFYPGKTLTKFDLSNKKIGENPLFREFFLEFFNFFEIFLNLCQKVFVFAGQTLNHGFNAVNPLGFAVFQQALLVFKVCNLFLNSVKPVLDFVIAGFFQKSFAFSFLFFFHSRIIVVHPLPHTQVFVVAGILSEHIIVSARDAQYLVSQIFAGLAKVFQIGLDFGGGHFLSLSGLWGFPSPILALLYHKVFQMSIVF